MDNLDLIAIHKRSGKKFKVMPNKDLHTHKGVVKWIDIEKGGIVKSSTGEEFIILKASFFDKIEFLKRGPQAANIKDISTILGYTGISSGWRVLEAGSGSGILTCFLANSVAPDGKVYSYEINKDFLKIAKKNVEKMGLKDYVVFKNKNIKEGIDEKDLDLVILDIGDPWDVVDLVHDSLKKGGFFVCLLPNITSVHKLLKYLEDIFYIDKILDVKWNDWYFKRENVLRPKSVQLVHTEFLIFARKI